MSRAVTYHRVSTSEQDQTLARDELRRAAVLRDLEVIDEIEETGSGARGDRPGLQRVMALARRGEIDTVLVQRLDRFGRSTLDLLANIRALTDVGIRFVAVTQSLDIRPDGDAMSQLILTVLAGVAEFERELIRERTKTGLEKAKRKGVRLGRTPVLTQSDVALARQLREQGKSWRAVAKELKASEATVRRCVKKGHPHERPARA